MEAAIWVRREIRSQSVLHRHRLRQLLLSNTYTHAYAYGNAYTYPTPTPGAITLSAHGRRVQGRHTVDLSWNGASSANVDIYRDGVVIATVPTTAPIRTPSVSVGQRTLRL